MKDSFADKRSKIRNLKNGNGIKYLIDEGYKILGNPIMMFDTSYTILAGNEVVTDDWVWNEIATMGTFRHETVDFFNQQHFIEAFAISETVTLLESEHLKYKRANGKLFDNDNVQLGNISVVACCKPFDDGDMELIEILCEMLSVELQGSEFYKKIDRVYQQSLVNQIISGNIAEDEIAASEIEQLFDGLKSNLYLAVVDITQYDKTNTHLAYFRDLFKRIQGQYKYYVHENNVVIIISTDDEVLNVKDDLKELREFFQKYKIYAGISSKFQKVVELNKYFGQALTALNYGLESKRAQNIFCYDDFKIEHLLYSVVDGIDKVCNPVVSLIQKHDHTLLDTLYIYLLYGMNLTLACENLAITPAELSARLNTIEQMFKVDWTNGNMLFDIFLSIKFVKTFEKESS